MGFGTPKGISDIWFEEFEKRRWVLSRIEKTLRSYGFLFVEPSPIEYLETLTAKSGPEIEKEIYSFEDKKGEKLALRFDLTVGMARMLASRQLPLPARLSSIGSMWRYDNPQHGRYRWFWQWDAEIFGPSSIEADAEIMALACDILDSVGLKGYSLKANNRKFIEAFLLSIGVGKESLLSVMRILDKSNKLRKEQLTEELKKAGLSGDQVAGIHKHMERLGTVVNEENDGKAKSGADDVRAVFDLMKPYGKKEKCWFDPSIVRGFDYYTGMVFEVVVKGEESLGSIAGGGRFDELAGIYGRAMPAVGAAGGIERLLISLENQGVLKPVGESAIAVLYANSNVLPQTIELSQALRKGGISAIMDVQGRDLRGQLEYANKRGLKKAVILGPKDLADGKATIRDMESGKEEKVAIKEVPKRLF